MTPAILIFIAIMWFPIALLLLGYGEPKGTGWSTLMVSLFVLIGATIQASMFHDPWTAGLLYVHGLFYGAVGWAFYTGATDLRPMGNVSLTTAIVSTIYFLYWLIGTEAAADASFGHPKVWYLAFMAAIYAILTYEVFLNAYGRLSGKILAWSLILGVIFSLWIPAFWLMAWGKFPWWN